jgi:hypothetical protein
MGPVTTRRKPPALQVLFEPWPDEAGADRDGYEAFAGQYLLDALEPDGSFRARGFRAVVSGCTTCRRDEKDPKVHVPNLNDLGRRKSRVLCPKWRRVEALVKVFGGWKRVHYVELDEHEGLQYQPIPQRRREVRPCAVCRGTGFGTAIILDEEVRLPECDAGCGSYTYGGSGEVQVTYEGPVVPDRHGMSAAQRRIRT